ncbi:MAG: thioredoxin family protein [Pirellulales bacterium]|nr:thioredoxin family protein [Pirellulales bacterium]
MAAVQFSRVRVAIAVLMCLTVLAAPRTARAGDGFDALEGPLFSAAPPSRESVVAVTAQFTPSTADRAGELTISVRIEPTWHIYSITQAPGGPLPTEIKLHPSAEYRLLGDFRAAPLPDSKIEPAFNNLAVETHHDLVEWRAPIEVRPGADPAALEIGGIVRVQPCNPDSCSPPQEIPFLARLAPNAAAAPVAAPAPPSSVSSVNSDAPQAAVPEEEPARAKPAVLAVRETIDRPLPDDKIAAFQPTALEISGDEEQKETPLTTILCFGFLGGLILNLMPCVLPVIGLKVLSFVQQAGQSRRRALALNLWYSLGMMSVFVLLAGLAVSLSLGWGQLFSFTGFNVALAAVVFTMALSLLGVWEIPIPGLFGAGKANDLSQREGGVGAFCKGVLTTILATPCSGPFLASALAWTVGQPPLKTYAVFLSAGIGMASPYLLIGVFPGLIRFLPKPGAWMETFKQAMGFVLLGTVAYLLTLVPWAYIVPTVAFLFGLWAACWWIGRVAATADFGCKARAWLSAAAFAGAIWLVAFDWLAEVTAERFQRAVQTARGGAEVAAIAGDEDQLQWRPFSRRALDELIAAEKTVLVDFTADWCMTCKTLEKFVLNTSKTRAAVRRNGVAALHADWTHASPEVTTMLELLGSKQVPVIAIFPAGDANHPIVLWGGYTQKMLLDALEKAGPSKAVQLAAEQDNGKAQL